MIKVFMHPTKDMYYVNTPVNGFQMRVDWTAVMSSTPGDGTPTSVNLTSVLDFSLNAAPSEVFGAAYTAILLECAKWGWEIPAKSDVYGWVPVDFETLMGGL